MLKKIVLPLVFCISMANAVEVYGHRGARTFSPENTMPAYKTGLAVGVDFVDMDIGITKDKVIIVDHDYWLNPDIVSQDGKFMADSKDDFVKGYTGDKLDQKVEPYLVKNLTLAQLQKYDVGVLNRKSPYAKFFPEQIDVPNTHMPTLAEVVKYTDKVSNRRVKFQIEVKNTPDHPNWTVSPKEFAQILYKDMQKYNLVGRSEIQSFDWEVLYELQKLNPKIKTAYLVGYEEIDNMKSSDPKIAGAWTGGKLLKDHNNSLPQMVKDLGGACYEPEDVTLTKEQLDEAHKLGLKVVVWTWPEHSGKAFDPVLVNKLIDWGIDGIITDDPARLNSILAARGKSVPKNYSIK